MPSALANLGALPAELIQRIASFCSCDTVLSLLKTNKLLNTVCNDIIVFKEIIRNGNGLGSEKEWDLDYANNDFPLTTVIRFAMADLRARETFMGNGPLSARSRATKISERWDGAYYDAVESYEVSRRVTDRFMTWAPHLAALDHPFLDEADLIGILGPLGEYHEDETPGYPTPRTPAEISNLTFLSIVACSKQIHNASQHVEPNRAEVYPRGSWDAARETQLETERNEDDLLPGSLLYPILSLIQSTNTDGPRNLLPPTKTPFDALRASALAEPFTNPIVLDAWKTDSISLKQYLEDGEWGGYYTLGQISAYTSVDPPMLGIHFYSTPLENGGGVAVTARGKDRVGDFSIAGTVSDDGVVIMRKNYDAGFGWDWRARMTPFGILGTWGPDYGKFWLWKRDWSGVVADGKVWDLVDEAEVSSDGSDMV